MKLEELRGQIDGIKRMLDDPQPGLISWCVSLGEKMERLIYDWECKALPPPEKVAQGKRASR